MLLIVPLPSRRMARRAASKGGAAPHLKDLTSKLRVVCDWRGRPVRLHLRQDNAGTSLALISC